MPSEEMLGAMAEVQRELVKAASWSTEPDCSKQQRARASAFRGQRSVVPGPFPETAGLIAGY